MKKQFLCIGSLLCLLFLGSAEAAKPLHSTLLGIIAGPDGARLPGALITLQMQGSKNTIRVVSNSAGAYLISELPAGSYMLSTELAGFELYTIPDLKLDPGTARIMDLILQLATIREIVTVVGASTRDSIEGAETRESAARDVGEIMADAPGIWILRKGGIANDFVLRGFQTKDLNVLIDGQRIYGACPNQMDPAAFHVDFAEVDRIEIGKGPFDVKNQGSLGGVVNIVTRKAAPGLHATGNLSTGSYGFVNPSATISFASNGYSVLGGYSYRRSSPFTDGSGKRFTDSLNYRPDLLDSDAFKIGTAWGQASFRPFPGQLAQFSYARQQADHILYPYLQMDAIYDDTDRVNAGYQVNNLSGLVRSLRLQAYYTRVNHWMTDQYRTSSLNMLREYSMGTLAGTEALGGKLEALLDRVTVGLEAYHREWDGTTQMAGGNYVPQYSIPNVRTDSFGLYSQLSPSLNEHLNLTFGGRLDTMTTAADESRTNTGLYYAYNSTRLTSKTNNFPSGSARISYRSAFGLELSGGVGHTVRVPDARERYFALKRMGTDWVGNPDLKPSRNTGLDASISFRQGSLMVESNLYLNYIRDYVSVVSRTKANMVPGIMNTKARSYQNVDARMHGGEILISYLLTSRLFLSSDLSYVRGSRNVMPERGILGPDLAEIPPLRFRTDLRYQTERYFAELEGVLEGAQTRVDTSLGEQPTPGYGIANLRAGLNFKQFSLRMGMNNIFGRQYSEHLSFQRDPFRSGARVCEPGRNFVVNLSYRY
jgi:iron complex outermembrane receptor protein